MFRIERAGCLHILTTWRTPWPQDHGIEEMGAERLEPQAELNSAPHGCELCLRERSQGQWSSQEHEQTIPPIMCS